MEEKLGSVELVVNRDAKKGGDVDIESLFSYGEQRKEFELFGDVKRWRTKIKAVISKIGILETSADITKKRGEKTCIRGLFSYPARKDSFAASEDIKKGDTISVDIELVG